MDKTVSVTIGGREYTVARARLGLYLDLEIVRSRLAKAVKVEENGFIVNALFDFLNLPIPDMDRGAFNQAPWQEIVLAYVHLSALNMIEGDFAILKYQSPGAKQVPWDYPERLKIVWIHSIATAYHWQITDIEQLQVEDAVGYLQEIVADEQLEKEFLHALSEVAYQYDQATKKSKYVPLHRPLWMVKRELDQIKTKIRRDLMPVGRIITIEEQLHKSERVH